MAKEKRLSAAVFLPLSLSNSIICIQSGISEVSPLRNSAKFRVKGGDGLGPRACRDLTRPSPRFSDHFAECLVPIFRALIFESGFPIVALLAKWLPVILVPEQCLISPVWLDMVDHSCRCQFSCPLALHAKRVTCQELLPRHLPAMAVASFKGTNSITNKQFGMLIAVTIVRQLRATGMLAWFLRSFRHNRLLLSYVRMRERMKNASAQEKEPGGYPQTHVLSWQL